jgi:hypothetical protein
MGIGDGETVGDGDGVGLGVGVGVGEGVGSGVGVGVAVAVGVGGDVGRAVGTIVVALGETVAAVPPPQAASTVSVMTTRSERTPQAYPVAG